VRDQVLTPIGTDGYGIWLWSLREHLRLAGGELGDQARDVVASTADYLNAMARHRAA
jgi:hypothetical protein